LPSALAQLECLCGGDRIGTAINRGSELPITSRRKEDRGFSYLLLSNTISPNSNGKYNIDA